MQTLALVIVEVFGRSLLPLHQALTLLATFVVIVAINMSCRPVRFPVRQACCRQAVAVCNSASKYMGTAWASGARRAGGGEDSPRPQARRRRRHQHTPTRPRRTACPSAAHGRC